MTGTGSEASVRESLADAASMPPLLHRAVAAALAPASIAMTAVVTASTRALRAKRTLAENRTGLGWNAVGYMKVGSPRTSVEREMITESAPGVRRYCLARRPPLC